MAYTYEDLKAMTIADLREIARGLQPALQGYTQMNKEHLLPALCAALGVDTHHHHRQAHRQHHGAHQVFDKPTMKATLRTLKTERALRHFWRRPGALMPSMPTTATRCTISAAAFTR